MILLGAAIAAVFANDGAALLLTPIVLAILLRLNFKPAAALAFIVACGFVADSTSLPLVISNLVNIVSANFFDISFSRYAAVMVPVNLVSLAATLVVLWLFYRRDLPATYTVAELEAPRHAIKDPLVFRAAFPLLGLLLVAYFVTAPFGVQVSVVTCAGALVLLALANRSRVIPIRKVLSGAPWQIVLFSLGMYLVVYGLKNAGLTDYLAQGLVWLSGHGPFVATIGTGFAAAILSSVMNNMPSVLVGALSIQQAPDLSPLMRELMVYANVIGCDLGPKFTPIGSLATPALAARPSTPRASTSPGVSTCGWVWSSPRPCCSSPWRLSRSGSLCSGPGSGPMASARRWPVISALGVVQILTWGSSFYLLSVLAAPMTQDTGWPLGWVIGGLSLGLLVAGLVSPRVGAFIGEHGGRPVLAFASIALALGLTGLALAPNVAAYLAAWLLVGLGMGTGLYDPAFATLGLLYGAEARPAITTLTLWGGFASTVCWPLSAFLIEQVGWRGTCLAYAGLAPRGHVAPRSAPDPPAARTYHHAIGKRDAYHPA